MHARQIDPGPAITHLPGIAPVFAATTRLRTHYLASGPASAEPVIFLHGNTAASTWWEETMLALPPEFRAIAPDLRGYGLSDPNGIIDASRGTQDWIDDLHALLVTLAIDRFHLAGHSLGGVVCWGVVADPRFAGRIRSVTLVAPGAPCGFGGVRGEFGKANNAAFSGSGAGLVHRQFVKRLKRRDRGLGDPVFSPRAVMNRVFWKPPFRCPREEDILTAMLQVHLGRHRFPGDFRVSRFWPWVAPGRFGPINALSPKYNQDVTRNVVAAAEKPPILVLFGADDLIISDMPGPDAGTLGKLGLLPAWPGDAVFPPQPVKSQVLATLARYRELGGRVEQRTIPDCGHSVFIEKPAEFRDAFHVHLQNAQGAAGGG